MGSNEHNKVIAFDTLFSTNHIAMLKIMLPYMDNQAQKSLAVYIKFLELNYTLDFYKKHPYPICGCVERESSPDFIKLCGELIPYCTEEEKKNLEQIRTIFQSMEMYKEMSKSMEMMKDFMPDMGNLSDLFSNSDSSGQGGGAPDIINILMNMMTPEQKEMFQLFGGNKNEQ